MDSGMDIGHSEHGQPPAVSTASPRRSHRRPPTVAILLLAAAAAPAAVAEEPKCVDIDYTVSSGLCAGLRLRGSRCLVGFLGLTSQQFGDRIVGLAEDNANLAACKDYAQTICLAVPVKQDYCAATPTAGVCERMRLALFGSMGCDYDSDCTLTLREYAPVGDSYNGFSPEKPCCEDMYDITVGRWCDATALQAEQTKELLQDIGRCWDSRDRPVACAALSAASCPRAPSLGCLLCSLLALFLAGSLADAAD